ncbi:hypothetical protein HW532_10115 [Kaustia mangrovi]|uniref:Uncharacterized protein n=1 Tax=Kaustia mangrovi TaxID=2593653 RepID=A0A7S8C422_9HYPH|nr:hypothetical protein [Kaustia mangrovi]QPC43013.1 hypothetical protein HW532_10115 [Kaustia mangrovi]
MVAIERSSPSNSQAFSGTEDRAHSDPSNEDRAFEAKLAQLQQQDTGQQLVRDKRQGPIIMVGSDGRNAIGEVGDTAFSLSHAEDVSESASAAGAGAAAAADATNGGGNISASPTPISQRPGYISPDGRVNPPNIGDPLGSSTSNAEDVSESVSTAGADAATQTTVSGPLKLGEGVTAQRLSAPVLEEGPAGSPVPQSEPVPLAASNGGAYLLSESGDDAKPIAFRGTESEIYDTLDENAGRVIEREPRKPGEDFAEASEDTRSIYAGFVADRGAAGSPDTPGHVSQLLSNIFGMGGASLASNVQGLESLAQAAKGLVDASQKTMLKISQYPEEGLTLVGTDSTTFGDIAETLRALPNRG